MKRILTTDTLLLAGYGAVCYGCWRLAPWSAFVVGGVLLMVYAWQTESAKAFQAFRRHKE